MSNLADRTLPPALRAWLDGLPPELIGRLHGPRWSDPGTHSMRIALAVALLQEHGVTLAEALLLRFPDGLGGCQQHASMLRREWPERARLRDEHQQRRIAELEAAMAGPSDRPPPEPLEPHWQAACAEFIRHTDDRMRRRFPILPWEREVRAGQIDFWQIHAHLLDHLPELLIRLLPHGTWQPDATWRGRPAVNEPDVIVSLLSGAWHAPGARRSGHDLLSLVAYVLRVKPGAAVEIIELELGIGARRNV